MKAKWFLVGLMAFSLFNACEKDITAEVASDNLPNISGYSIVGSNQSTSFDNAMVISIPTIGQDYYRQNANYPGIIPSYTDNGDGTVTNNVTGLMWQNTLDHNGDGLINVNADHTTKEQTERSESVRHFVVKSV